jgi:potassium efflux system protein
VPELLASARQRLLEATEGEGAPKPAEGPPELLEPQRCLLRATILATEAEIAGLSRELPTYEAQTKLHSLRIDQALRVLAAKEKETKDWEEKVRERRREEAERAAREAKEELLEVTGASPGIRQFAENLAAENAALAEQRTSAEGILRRIDETSRGLAETKELLKRVQTDFEGAEKRVEAGSLNAPLGVMLRKYRAELPDLGDRKADIRARRRQIEQAQVKIIELREERLKVSDVEGILSEKMRGVDSSLPDYQQRRMRRLLRELLWTKRDALQSLLDDYNTYFLNLVELDTTERELVRTVQAFDAFINERILWVRSVEPFTPETAARGWSAVKWMLRPHNWRQVVRTLWDDVWENLSVYILVTLLLAGVLAGRRKMTARLRAVHEEAGKPTCSDFGLTVEALFLTVLITAFWPALAGFLGWRLRSLGGGGDFLNAIGSGLEFTAVTYLTLEIPRQVFRPGGLGRVHFGWPRDWLDDLYRILGRSFAIFLPAVFVIAAAEGQADEALKVSLGRIAFVLLMLAVSILLFVMLRPRLSAKGTEAPAEGERPIRGRRFWYMAIVAVPLAIGIVEFLGYYYAALQLGLRLQATASLVIAVLILHGMIMRWLLLARRRLAIEQNRKRMEAAEAATEDGAGEEASGKESLDLAKVHVQTTRLVRSIIAFILVIGIWLIWVEVVAAFGVLREVDLWHTTQQISRTVVDAEGETKVETLEQFRAVTLADLLLALLILAMTVMATRNLPGLVQVVLLQRTRLGTGERNAISTIVQYTIIVIGGSLVFRTVGVGWGNVQWLVAALGVGIGFGLQEIVANFISGLILLFERPIRVGDAVTVGDVSGTVSRIRIRATSITTWDRKELIVPNKEFIVGRLVNWTLSDTVIRVLVPVGIAYGSDTEKATELLLEVAKKNPKVLEDPAPTVLFMGFGSSSLDFELRTYTHYENALSLRHELHMAVDKAFRKAKIEIAFPQQDVHIRSVEDVFPIAAKEPDEEPAPTR